MEKHRRAVVNLAHGRSPRAQLAMLAAFLGAAAILLVCFPPDRYTFYPRCPLHAWLGVQCPGCGLTRALADILAGRMRDAAGHNALGVALAPCAVAFGLVQTYSVSRWNRWRQVPVARAWMAAGYAAVGVFAVARNLAHGSSGLIGIIGGH